MKRTLEKKATRWHPCLSFCVSM